MLSDGNALVQSQITLWKELIRPNIDRALALVPDDKLDWAPAANMLTLGNIFLHISECSDWWYGEVIRGSPAMELSGGSCPPKTIIAMLLDAHWSRLDELFARPPETLSESYSVTREGKTTRYDGCWLFTHLLEHDIHHRGQINQYLRILGITPPEI